MRPKEGERGPQLDVRAKDWVVVLQGLVVVHLQDLLCFNMIGAVTEVVDAALQIPRASVEP